VKTVLPPNSFGFLGFPTLIRSWNSFLGTAKDMAAAESGFCKAKLLITRKTSGFEALVPMERGSLYFCSNSLKSYFNENIPEGCL